MNHFCITESLQQWMPVDLSWVGACQLRTTNILFQLIHGITTTQQRKKLNADDQNLKSGSTVIAQLNFESNVFGKTFSIGTSFRLHHATVILGSR